MSILLEYVIVFIVALILFFFINRFNEKNLPKGRLMPELLYLKKIYHVNANKIEKNSFSRITLFINAFIISTVYIILTYLANNFILIIILGSILLILMAIICYGLLARYYLWKEGE